MPGRNKTPLLGWHPPAELAAWARTEAKRRGVPLARILDAALREYRERAKDAERAERTQPSPATNPLAVTADGSPTMADLKAVASSMVPSSSLTMAGLESALQEYGTRTSDIGRAEKTDGG